MRLVVIKFCFRDGQSLIGLFLRKGKSIKQKHGLLKMVNCS